MKAWTYNGQVPGPVIKVADGDKVAIVVKNELPQSTSVHWHGIEVPNDMDGVPYLTQDPITPGKTFTYSFAAHGPAVGMYHSHDYALGPGHQRHGGRSSSSATSRSPAATDR